MRIKMPNVWTFFLSHFLKGFSWGSKSEEFPKGKQTLKGYPWMSNAGKGKGRRYRQQKVYGTNIRSVKGKKEIAHWKTVLLLDFPNNCLIYWYYGLVEFFTEMLNLASSIQPNFIFPSLFSFAVLLWHQMDFWIASLFFFSWQDYMWCTSLNFFVFNLEKPENPLIYYLICSRCS